MHTRELLESLRKLPIIDFDTPLINTDLYQQVSFSILLNEFATQVKTKFHRHGSERSVGSDEKFVADDMHDIFDNEFKDLKPTIQDLKKYTNIIQIFMEKEPGLANGDIGMALSFFKEHLTRNIANQSPFNISYLLNLLEKAKSQSDDLTNEELQTDIDSLHQLQVLLVNNTDSATLDNHFNKLHKRINRAANKTLIAELEIISSIIHENKLRHRENPQTIYTELKNQEILLFLDNHTIQEFLDLFSNEDKKFPITSFISKVFFHFHEWIINKAIPSKEQIQKIIKESAYENNSAQYGFILIKNFLQKLDQDDSYHTRLIAGIRKINDYSFFIHANPIFMDGVYNHITRENFTVMRNPTEVSLDANNSIEFNEFKRGLFHYQIKHASSIYDEQVTLAEEKLVSQPKSSVKNKQPVAVIKDTQFQNELNNIVGKQAQKISPKLSKKVIEDQNQIKSEDKEKSLEAQQNDIRFNIAKQFVQNIQWLIENTDWRVSRKWGIGGTKNIYLNQVEGNMEVKTHDPEHPEKIKNDYLPSTVFKILHECHEAKTLAKTNPEIWLTTFNKVAALGAQASIQKPLSIFGFGKRHEETQVFYDELKHAYGEARQKMLALKEKSVDKKHDDDEGETEQPAPGLK